MPERWHHSETPASPEKGPLSKRDFAKKFLNLLHEQVRGYAGSAEGKLVTYMRLHRDTMTDAEKEVFHGALKAINEFEKAGIALLQQQLGFSADEWEEIHEEKSRERWAQEVGEP
ncbi:MAG: hypothetical protein PHN49_06750 [Candidatus Omnitrophica bacterium]|jgi:hypothetical protein|nr:hypothetical protein [Candidatus Omnitrophota bacterium]